MIINVPEVPQLKKGWTGNTVLTWRMDRCGQIQVEHHWRCRRPTCRPWTPRCWWWRRHHPEIKTSIKFNHLTIDVFVKLLTYKTNLTFEPQQIWCNTISYLDGVGSWRVALEVASKTVINADHSKNAGHLETPFAECPGQFLSKKKYENNYYELSLFYFRLYC